MLAAISLLLVLTLGGGPAIAFDIHDDRLFRDSGYRWCRQCDLSRIDLSNANLSLALLPEVNLKAAILKNAILQGADLRSAVLLDANLRGAKLWSAMLEGASLYRADLRGAFLEGAYLKGAYLESAQLQKARLSDADLESAVLVGAQLQGAALLGAGLQGAYVAGANARGARLGFAELRNADLQGANLRHVNLEGASVEGAKLAFADLSGALYAPASPPPDGYVEGIKGLSTVLIPYDETSQQAKITGLVQLRELLQKAGLRDQEREATYSIERAKTHHALDRWSERPLRAAEGVFRLLLFEWPVAYGLDPWRAFQVMLSLVLLLSFAYLPWIRRRGRKRRRGGAMYRIWPNERLVEDAGTVRLLTYGDVPERQRAERLQAKGMLGRYGYALWFSLLSAFHIGWRDLSVGTWLSRLQPREYALRAQGWPRFISGMQSLISVYLIAIWALTYFGRPFQ